MVSELYTPENIDEENTATCCTALYLLQLTKTAKTTMINLAKTIKTQNCDEKDKDCNQNMASGL